MSISRSARTTKLLLRGVCLAGVLVSLMILVPEAASARGHGYRAGQGAGGGWNKQCANKTRQGYGQGQGKGQMRRAGYRWNEISITPEAPCGRLGSCPMQNAMMSSKQN